MSADAQNQNRSPNPHKYPGVGVHDTKKSVFSIKAFPGSQDGYPWMDPRHTAMGEDLRYCAIYSRLLDVLEVRDILEKGPSSNTK